MKLKIFKSIEIPRKTCINRTYILLRTNSRNYCPIPLIPFKKEDSSNGYKKSKIKLLPSEYFYES